MSQISSSEMLCYSTVRIECLDSGGISTGTGFFFDFGESEDINELVIITNKHVVEGAVQGKLIFVKADENNNPIDLEHVEIILDNFESLWIFHPDTDVDICALPAKFIREKVELNRIFYGSFGKDIIPTEKETKEFSTIEEIYMIGYPNGIWDSHNNKPIIRKGITATNLNLDYCGKSEFLIDAACFPGSSGSPVIIYNRGEYLDKEGNRFNVKYRVLLLGILYAGPQHTVTGEIEIVNVPTKQKAIAFSTIPNNLGFVIKAQKILDLEHLF